MSKRPISDELAERVPPGQHLVDKFPVLSYGPTPRFNPKKWDLRVFGMVDDELRFSYEEFRALPLSRQRADFHCVTTWSKLDNLWEGVRLIDLMARVRLKPEARYVIVHCDGGYTTNLPLEEFVGEDHGWPLRLVVPKLYGWKSAKWVRAIEFTFEDRRGFWEVRGYHNHADPWTEERYSFQDDSED